MDESNREAENVIKTFVRPPLCAPLCALVIDSSGIDYGALTLAEGDNQRTKRECTRVSNSMIELEMLVSACVRACNHIWEMECSEALHSMEALIFLALLHLYSLSQWGARAFNEVYVEAKQTPRDRVATITHGARVV